MPLTDRIIDISENGADLCVRNNQLVISSGGAETTVPMSDIAVLVISHPAVRITHAVLSGLCTLGGICVFSTERRLPAGMLLPVEGNSVQARRFVEQAAAPLPARKRIWKNIIKAKITSQGKLLTRLKGEDNGLCLLSSKVMAGDATNIEAQASKRYWIALFGERFKRDPDGLDQNRLLNYGYAVLRGAVARAICSSGLHPSIGVHHHNKYNAFCLADDLMEPFRTVVDEAVYSLVQVNGPSAVLERENKATIIRGIAEKKFDIKGETRNLFDVLTRLTASLAGVYAGERANILLPDL